MSFARALLNEALFLSTNKHLCVVIFMINGKKNYNYVIEFVFVPCLPHLFL